VQLGDSGTKRVKLGQEVTESSGEAIGPIGVATVLSQGELAMATVASTSLTGGKAGSSGVDQLPKEMHDMKIRDEKVDHSDDKVY
jgi:hypothetical protein